MVVQLTWYDVLDILPDCPVQDVQGAFEAKAAVLRPELLSGAPAAVMAAAGRARAAIEAAHQCLSEPAARRRYDEQIGLRRAGGGLAGPADVPTEQGPDPLSLVRGGMGWDDAVAALGALADLLAPRPALPRRVDAPDLRGLFIGSCRRFIAGLGPRLEVVQLTSNPMPVEGLVVAQQPAPGTRVGRAGTLTVHVWHPSRLAF